MILKKLLNIVQVLLILVFLGCVVFIGKYFYDAYKAQTAYDELKDIIRQNSSEQGDGTSEDTFDENGILTDYSELYKKNNDMVGWLTITGTKVDYPVVKAADNSFYLHRNFEKANQYSGIPFMDYQCTDNSQNVIIYAHNMKNGTMFAAITDYESKAFFNTHKRIKFDTLYERGEYEIISAFSTKVGAKNEFKYYNYADIKTEDRFNEYVSKAKALSFYDTDVTASFGDRLLTLSTCAYHTSNERFVVVAKKV